MSTSLMPQQASQDRQLLLAWIALALGTTLGCSDPKLQWQAAGRAEARQDIADGKLCYRIYGGRHGAGYNLSELAQEKLGVAVVQVAFCTVSEEECEHSDAYNEVMLEEINRRHGPGAFDAVEALAQENYRRVQEQSRREWEASGAGPPWP